MRINVYNEELTSEVIAMEKKSNTGTVYRAAQLILHSSSELHHPPHDDDRSAVTFWLPLSPDRREEMAQAFEKIAAIFREPEPEAPLSLDEQLMDEMRNANPNAKMRLPVN